MKRWLVYLPGNVRYTMKSDHPHEDMAAQGHNAYGLVEITGMPHIPDIPKPTTVRRKSAGTRRQKGQVHG